MASREDISSARGSVSRGPGRTQRDDLTKVSAGLSLILFDSLFDSL